MVYNINQGSHQKANELGFYIQSSSKKLKKIDVYRLDSREYYCSIGDTRKMDYYEILDKYGILTACNHRRKYRILHRYDKRYEEMLTHRILN
jgi:hypothetical protein